MLYFEDQVFKIKLHFLKSLQCKIILAIILLLNSFCSNLKSLFVIKKKDTLRAKFSTNLTNRLINYIELPISNNGIIVHSLSLSC